MRYIGLKQSFLLKMIYGRSAEDLKNNKREINNAGPRMKPIPSSYPFGVQKMPKFSYIIWATQRSGSNLLCQALSQTRLCGTPDEYFQYWYFAEKEPDKLQKNIIQPWLLPPDAYMRRVFQKGTTPNGVFGVKLMWAHFDLVIEKLRTLPEYCTLSSEKVLSAVFPNLHHIYITRKNKVRQAVSMAKAIQSDRWIEYEPQDLLLMEKIEFGNNRAGRTVEENTLFYDGTQVADYYRMFQKHELELEDYFKNAGLKPYRVVYEQFVKSYEMTVRDILSYLNISDLPDSYVFRKSCMKRQTDAINEEWVRRFKQDFADVFLLQ